MATINSSETARAAATKNYPARNSFYNILINVRDNSMLSSPRIKRHTGARQFQASERLVLTLRSARGARAVLRVSLTGRRVVRLNLMHGAMKCDAQVILVLRCSESLVHF